MTIKSVLTNADNEDITSGESENKENNITEVLLCVVGALNFRECSQQPCEGSRG